MSIESFAIPSFESECRELRERLATTRWPEEGEWKGWSYGLDPTVLRELVGYWGSEFDGPARLSSLARHANGSFETAEGRLHFVRLRSDAAECLPVLLLHGWPSSVFELVPVAERLVDSFASSFGDQLGVDAIVPSLPGFGLSDAPAGPTLHASHAAARLVELMTALGHDCFFVHGGDFGANICNRLGLFHAERIRAIHAMAAPYPGEVEIRTPLSPEEQEFVAYSKRWYETHGAYMHLHRTQSQTSAYALSDSPVGLCAWLFEKFWSWCEFERDVREVVSRDDLLTNITWYWVTSSISTANRYYADRAREQLPAAPRIDVPTRLFLTLERVDRCPEEWARRVYTDLDYGLAEAGGHFIAWEQPDLLARELHAFLSSAADAHPS